MVSNVVFSRDEKLRWILSNIPSLFNMKLLAQFPLCLSVWCNLNPLWNTNIFRILCTNFLTKIEMISIRLSLFVNIFIYNGYMIIFCHSPCTSRKVRVNDLTTRKRLFFSYIWIPISIRRGSNLSTHLVSQNVKGWHEQYICNVGGKITERIEKAKKSE